VVVMTRGMSVSREMRSSTHWDTNKAKEVKRVMVTCWIRNLAMHLVWSSKF